MKQVVTAFVAMICFALFSSPPGDAQQPQPKPVQVTLINLTGVDVSIQGQTHVGNVVRNGAIMQLKKMGGTKAFEPAPPGTPRFYTVSNPLQPATRYLVSSKVDIPNRDVTLKIMISPTNPKMLVIVAE